MRRLLGAALLSIAVLGVASSAPGQDCAFTPAIRALSHIVLDGRAALTPIRARHVGAEAAYLILRYDQSGETESQALVRPLADAGDAAAQDLLFAWSIETMGYEAAFDSIGSKLLEVGVTGVSTSRALLLSEGRDALLARLGAERPTPIYDVQIKAVLDQPDALKAELAKLAVASGQPILAAGFVASQRDPAAWQSFIGQFGPRVVEQATAKWRWQPPLLGNPQLSTAPADAGLSGSPEIYQLVIASAKQPQRDFLLSFSNFTGWMEESAQAAAAVLAGLDSGALPQKGPLDKGWLVAYRALLESGRDAAEVRKALGSYELQLDRYGRRKVIDILDWIIAVDALGPYLRGETATPPAPPPGLSASWQQWLARAGEVKAGAISAGDETIAQFAEILLEARKVGELVAMLDAATPGEAQVMVANDMAIRLDRMCAAYLWHPAESVLLPQTPVFKFD